MKTILLAGGTQLGTFNLSDLETTDTGYVILDVVYPFTVLGEHTIAEYVEPPITVTPTEVISHGN